MFGIFGNHTVDKKFTKEPKKPKKPENSIKKVKLAVDSEIKYMAGQLCHIIDTELKEGKKSVKIFTPFSDEEGITIQREPYGGLNLYVNCKPSNYETLSNDLKNSKNFNQQHLETIYDYLNLLSDKNIKSTESFKKFVKEHWKDLNLNDLTANKDNKVDLRKTLDTLSALLMVAEPFRFLDQGRQSRAIIRRMYQNFEDKDARELTKSLLTNQNIAAKINNMITFPKEYDNSMEDDYDYMSDDEYEVSSPRYISTSKIEKIKKTNDGKMRKKQMKKSTELLTYLMGSGADNVYSSEEKSSEEEEKKPKKPLALKKEMKQSSEMKPRQKRQKTESESDEE